MNNQNSAPDETYLARWTYTPAEWEQYVKQFYSAEKGRGKLAIPISVGMAVLMVGAGIIWSPQNVPFLLAFSLLYVLLAYLVNIYLPQKRMVKRQHALGEARIFADHAVIYQDIYVWDLPAEYTPRRLERITFQPGSPAFLEFTISFQRRGEQYETFIIPVPAGQEDTARQVMNFFEKRGTVITNKSAFSSSSDGGTS